MPRPLNSQQRAFCAAYCKTRNQREAAISAGYSANTAAVIACNLMKKPLIAAEIARLTTRAQKKSELSAQLVMDTVADLLTFDPARLYDQETGQLLPVHQMDPVTRKSIAGIEQKLDGTKLRLSSRLGSAELAAKLLNMVNQERNTAQSIQIVLQAPTPQADAPTLDGKPAQLLPDWGTDE